ncbi:MAG TPA: SusD/RagB family nutrient-binding outer membrane lipoprotein [Saprospiraceae bacterium]|nr:SusD/RagB family nutrient-binding outer membrane lipoprotein [Saprospiraceae bacterium]
MKIRFKYIMSLLILSLLGLGCSEFLDINDDPNNPTTAPISGLMINTTFETARNVQRVGAITSFFVQHFASPNEATGTDIHDRVSYATQWSSLYFNLGDLNVLIDQAEAIGAHYYSGPAKIMKAFNLSLLVGMFGDVPYSQAFSTDVLQPAYDNSESIYQAMLQLLNEGISDLNAEQSVATPGNDDFIFKGNRDLWRKTAFALQARFLNHFSKTPNYNPSDVLSAVDNAFTGNADDFQLTFFASPIAAQNQWYRTAVLNAGLNLGGWLSTQIVNQLNGTTYGIVDPRITFITAPATNPNFPDLIGQYIGTRNGAGRGAAPEQGVRAVLAVGSYYALNATQPLEMATYAELKFIEAEAALAAGNRQRAYQAYETGIRAHMTKLGVPSANIQAYWNHSSVSVGMNNLSVNHIMKEKYVATFLNPETWNDARRFNYQYVGFQPPANSALGGELIRLADYPDSEYQRNIANVPNRSMTDRIFWDLN